MSKAKKGSHVVLQIETLSKSDVLRIHNHLVEDFALTADPIAPPGLKSEEMLESAIGRQHVCYDGHFKYKTVHEITATLLYGLCLGHPFHNGNKRTALVSMLAQLDKNKLCLVNVGKKELYSIMIEIASHTFGLKPSGKKRKSAKRRNADDEVAALALWIKSHITPITRGERQITYRGLNKILKRFGYELRNQKKSMIDIVKLERVRKRLFSKEFVIKPKKIYSISYPGENNFVNFNTLKRIRRVCNLTEEDGVDSAAFYDDDVIIDSFINRYRTILRRLAKT